MKTSLIRLVSSLGCVALLAGCAQQQQQHKYTDNTPAATSPAPAPAPAKPGTVTAYFPSGSVNGSGLAIEKTAPAQVLAGQPFEYTYKVSNLTDETLENVTIRDRVSSNFAPSDADPAATSNSGGIATWSLGTLGPKESKTITVKGASADEGVVTTCGWATYNPIVCQDIQVVKANIALTKTEPADALICDTIPVTLNVKNTGSSGLTGVQIVDSLPSGLTSDGKQSLTFDVGALAPGEAKEIKYNTSAASTGKFVNQAKATSAEGVSAEASATTTVHQPVLAVTCNAPEQQFMGRKFQVCYTVSNTGDADAAGSVLSVNVPAGVTVSSTTANGQAANGVVNWDLGTIAAGGSQNVCATYTSDTAGTYAFAGTAKGACATPVSTSCQTKVVGIAAILMEKWDDPDPVAIGDTTTYTCKITNQGTADDHDVQVVVVVDAEFVPVSCSSNGTIDGNTITFPVVPTLAPKAVVTFTVVAKGVKAGDAHTLFKLSSEVLKAPITAQESTHVY